MHEALGSRARAIELYETVRGVFGADKVTISAAERALARLTTFARVR